MKKILSLVAIISISIFFTGCSKTEVDMDLENANKNKNIMTEEEFNELSKEDQEFQTDYIEAMIDATEEQRLDESIALIDELEEAKTNKETGNNFKGSCNAIDESSVCIEYYGSFWTTQSISLACTDVGIYSSSGCPRDMAGGCNTGIGTDADMVTWMYTRGGGEIDAEGLKYAKLACDATLASQWILSK